MLQAAHTLTETKTGTPSPQGFRPEKPQPRLAAQALSLDILLVEDNPSDRMLTEIALEATQLHYRLHTLSDGDAVLPYLARQGRHAEAQLPDVILLDLTLPHRDGFELLAEFVTRPELQKIPIIILTGAEHYEYLMKTYNLWLPAYVTKPCTAEKLAAALRTLKRPRHSRGSKVIRWH